MVDVTVAILDDQPGAAGIFFYFRGRRFAHWSWTDTLTKTIVQKAPQHRLNSHFRVEVDFQGKIEDVPINANKDEVVTSRPIFGLLSRTVAKLVQPYLSIVSWMSKDNNMGYLQRMFRGPENAHRTLASGSVDLPAVFPLGKVYDGMQIGRPRVADPSALFAIILADRNRVVEDQSARPETAVSAPRDIDPPSIHEELAEGSLAPIGPNHPDPKATKVREERLSRRQGISATMTVSLYSENPEDLRTLKTEIENAAKTHAIEISIT